MSDFEALLRTVRECSQDQKQRIFSEIRDAIVIHDLERAFNIRAEVILEAINRATDLTQRGVRGVIAETVFVLDILPTLKEWEGHEIIGDQPYDALVRKGRQQVRIQVKMQRKVKGQPMRRGNSFVAEVQRTRTGKKNGVSTRPYRFEEFDLLAVCMEPSTKDWHSFMYVPTISLDPDPNDNSIIRTFQSIPGYSDDNHGAWTSDLTKALEKTVAGNEEGKRPRQSGLNLI